jgi:hypothetical protein
MHARVYIVRRVKTSSPAFFKVDCSCGSNAGNLTPHEPQEAATTSGSARAQAARFARIWHARSIVRGVEAAWSSVSHSNSPGLARRQAATARIVSRQVARGAGPKVASSSHPKGTNPIPSRCAVVYLHRIETQFTVLELAVMSLSLCGYEN